MSGTGVSLYAVTAAGNKTVIGTIDWREDIYMPSQINDNVAQIMADIRNMANAIAVGWIEVGDGEGTYTAIYVSATQFAFAGLDLRTYYRVGMRVRVVAPTPGTLSGTITVVAYSGGSTIITAAWDSGVLSNEAITSVSLGVGSGDTTAPVALSHRNILGRNGGFEVWQRGAGGTAAFSIAAGSSQYTADGWVFYTPTAACTVGQTAGIVNGSLYSLVAQRNAGQTGVGQLTLEYPLDTNEIVQGAGSRVTLSFTATAAPTFSPAGGIVTCGVKTGTAAPAKRFAVGYTGETDVIVGSAALTSTTTRFTFTSSVVVPTNATQACVYFQWTPVGTAGASDYPWLDDLQLEAGTVASAFERRPFESELAACRRHFWKTFAYHTKPDYAIGVATGENTWTAPNTGIADQWSPRILFPVVLRATPTLIFYNPVTAATGAVRNYSASNDLNGSTPHSATSTGTAITATGLAGTVAGHLLAIHLSADAGI